MNHADDENVEVGDDTLPVREQARSRGWDCDFFSFGKAAQSQVEFFNPGLVRRPDGLWLLVRRSEIVVGMPYGRNMIWAAKLDGEKKVIGGPILKFPNSKTDEQFEDPRGVYWNGQTWIACVNFTWFSNASWTGAHMMLGVFQDKGGADITEATWSPLARRDPLVGTNQDKGGHTQGHHNKNVLFWFLNDKLYCLYTSDPWLVVEFGTKWEDQVSHIADGVKWKYGVVRGGTPPVLVGDKFYTFFHSSLPWRGRFRRYYMGAIAFESKPPFKPVLWTQEPLLIGSQNDKWGQKKPLVVFPCGAVMENGKWLVTFGVNDLASAWVEIPHEDLQMGLNPIPVVPGLSLLSDRTAVPEYAPIPFEQPEGGEEKCAAPAENLGVARLNQNAPDIPAASDAAPTSNPNGAAEPLRGTDQCDCDKKPGAPYPACPHDMRGHPGEPGPKGMTKLQMAAANARAVLAEKRKAGLVVRKKRKRRKKKKALKS